MNSIDSSNPLNLSRIIDRKVGRRLSGVEPSQVPNYASPVKNPMHLPAGSLENSSNQEFMSLLFGNDQFAFPASSVEGENSKQDQLKSDGTSIQKLSLKLQENSEHEDKKVGSEISFELCNVLEKPIRVHAFRDLNSVKLKLGIPAGFDFTKSKSLAACLEAHFTKEFGILFSVEIQNDY